MHANSLHIIRTLTLFVTFQMFTSPLLAATILDVTKLSYPLMATPKFDGIRVLTLPPVDKTYSCRAVTRKWKPIPNDHVRRWMELNLCPGLDGEAMVPGEFHDVSSGIMKKEGKPDFTLNFFDLVGDNLDEPYYQRAIHLSNFYSGFDLHVGVVTPKRIDSLAQLENYEEHCLTVGFEGVMLRRQLSPYKCGRSTLREAFLLKLKRVDQSEAYVIASFEEEANNNPLERDAFGNAKRSTHKANKAGKGRLGGFICKPEEKGPLDLDDVEWVHKNVRNLKAAVQKHPYFFSVGSGFNDLQRKEWWPNQFSGNRLTYAHQLLGAKKGGKPRFPRFKGFRHADD